MATGNDMKMHKGTYGSFIGMLKWTVPLIVAISAIVVLIIAS
ncbi:aa3-type cytochrome c oxidase subunit IV [Tsuneonella amylolytica]|nr:aa3-type cytochrome c oxidase subunit IV [Tsuneonella amylolytica]